LSSNDKEPESTRRNVLKTLVLFGAGLLIVPTALILDILIPPVESGPVKYPNVLIANSEDLSPNTSLLFEYPQKDRPAILVRLSDGSFAAYDATCTHLGCQVHYNKSQQIFCPCHGGTFDGKTGEVIGGPPLRPLPRIKLKLDLQGNIYAEGYESGLPLYGEG
jgi:Rieske Fe-S protein